MDYLLVFLAGSLIYLWVIGERCERGGYQPRENAPPRRPIDPGEPPKGKHE